MRKMLGACLGLLLAAGLVVAADTPAAKVAGAWELTSEGRQGPTTQTLTFEQDGEKLKGTMKGQRGEAPVEGTIKGKDIKFSVKRSGPQGEMVIEYSGTVDGDSMKGTVQSPMGSRDWTAKRAKPQ
jgi:hypothetical protein